MRAPRTPLLLGAGLLSAGLLGLTGTGTLSAVMAQVVTSPNTASLGRMVLELRSDRKGEAACSSAEALDDVFVCKTIQPLGGRDDLLPGEPAVTSITVVNSGTIDPSTLTLRSDDCAPTGSPSDDESKKAYETICRQVAVRVEAEGEVLFDGPVAKLSGAVLPLPAPRQGESERVSFTTTASKELGNAYQGLGVSVPMTWTFQQ